MEYIKKEELIEGEIYKADNGSLTYIMKATKDLENVKNIPEYCEFMRHGCFNGLHLTFTNATPEEKHWLNCCITANKFITFEEAMKSFIPEYVELLPGWSFDGEFVVKEPEFVLPEKWCILRTGNNYNIINKWFQDNNLGKPYMNYGYIWKSNNNYYTYLTKPGHRTEITFDQFKKYVLKEEIVEEKVIEPLPQFKIIETIETITKVENNEGNQFFIGDVVKTEVGLHFKIIGFKYNENKTKILAIATDNYPEVVKDINDIEHYIEPKVEETLLEKAKRLYPIGTKFINPNDNEECVIKEKGNYFKGNNNNIYHSIANTVFKYEEGLSGCIYINNTWSKIIE